MESACVPAEGSRVTAPRSGPASCERAPARPRPRSRRPPNATTSPTVGRLGNGNMSQTWRETRAPIQAGSPGSEPQPPPGHGGSRNLRPSSPEETPASGPGPGPGPRATRALSEEASCCLAHRYAGSRASSKNPGYSVGAWPDPEGAEPAEAQATSPRLTGVQGRRHQGSHGWHPPLTTPLYI